MIVRATFRNSSAAGDKERPVILQGLEEFREHLGGELTITLIPAIGRKLEVHEMDEDAVLGAVDDLRLRADARRQSSGEDFLLGDMTPEENDHEGLGSSGRAFPRRRRG